MTGPAAPDGSSLVGCRVLVTRAREQAGGLTAHIEALGGEVVEFAVLQVVPPPDWTALDAALERAGDGYDWAVFTSVNGVRAFFQRLEARDQDVRDWRGVRLAAIGPVTAGALRAAGLRVDVVPAEYRAEALLEAMTKADEWEGRRVALIRAWEARQVLPDGLRNLGAWVDVIPAYRTVEDGEGVRRVATLLDAGHLHAITFASPSAVRFFCQAVPRAPERVRKAGAWVACIGPVTARAAEEWGFHVDVMAHTYTAAGLADALARAWHERRGR